MCSRAPADSFINIEPTKRGRWGVEFVLDKDSGGVVVAQLKVLPEVNSCDNLQLLSFLFPEKQFGNRNQRRCQETKDINMEKKT